MLQNLFSVSFDLNLTINNAVFLGALVRSNYTLLGETL